MSDIAKVFGSGRFQAIRLPENHRVDADEVEITREGETLIMRPRKRPGWSGLLAALDAFDVERFAECFPAGRDQPAGQERSRLNDAIMR